MYLHLIRHAQSLANIGRAGSPNDGLSDLGVWQASQVPVFFHGIRPAAIFCSPLRRVVETALPLSRALDIPITLVPEMSEFFNGDWPDYRDYDWESCEAITAMFDNASFIPSHDLSAKWWPDWPETAAQVRQRVKRFLERDLYGYYGSDEQVVIFGHGQSIADMQALINNGFQHPVHNAAVITLRLNERGELRTASLNTDHLGPHITG